MTTAPRDARGGCSPPLDRTTISIAGNIGFANGGGSFACGASSASAVATLSVWLAGWVILR